MTESPQDIDELDITSLKALVLELLEDQAALRAENAVLREEIRRLKGLSGPPDIKPSGMDGEARSRGKAGHLGRTDTTRASTQSSGTKS